MDTANSSPQEGAPAQAETLEGKLQEAFRRIGEFTLQIFQNHRNLTAELNFLCEAHEELTKELEDKMRELDSMSGGAATASFTEASRLETEAIRIRIEAVFREIVNNVLAAFQNKGSLPWELVPLCESYEILRLIPPEAIVTKQSEPPAPPLQAEPPPQEPLPQNRQEVPTDAPPSEPAFALDYPPVPMTGRHYQSRRKSSKVTILLFALGASLLFILGLHFAGKPVDTPRDTKFEGQLTYFEKSPPQVRPEESDTWKEISRFSKIQEGETIKTLQTPVAVITLAQNSLRMADGTRIKLVALRKAIDSENTMVIIRVDYGRIWIQKKVSAKLLLETGRGSFSLSQQLYDLTVEKDGTMSCAAWRGGGSFTQKRDKRTFPINDYSLFTLAKGDGEPQSKSLQSLTMDLWQEWNTKNVEEPYTYTMEFQDSRKRPKAP